MSPAPPPKKPAPLAVEVPSGHVLLGGPGFDSRGAPTAAVDPIPLLQMLREKRFADLERELTWLDGEFRRDVRNERRAPARRQARRGAHARRARAARAVLVFM